jgi:hypothetical protein
MAFGIDVSEILLQGMRAVDLAHNRIGAGGIQAFVTLLESGASKIVQLKFDGNLVQRSFSRLRHDSMNADESETVLVKLQAALAANQVCSQAQPALHATVMSKANCNNTHAWC